MNSKKLASRAVLVLSLICSAGFAQAASRGDLHVAVYSAGFLVDTQRQVTYGDRASRVGIKTQTKGTAKGESPDSAIEISRVDQGLEWHLDPRSKTYSETRYQASFGDEGRPSSVASTEPPTLKVSKIDPKVTGPLGSDTINGYPCQSYTIRIVVDFSNPQTGKVVATETLLEKLWVTEKAPLIQAFRKEEENYRDSLMAIHGTEKASFRWMVRELNRHILEMNGNPEDFRSLQMTYQGARASIPGVTVRQLAGWNWRTKDPSAPGADAADDLNTFVASVAAGLGAPPDTEGKTALSESDKPSWVKNLEQDLGRTGPTALILEEVVRAHAVTVKPDFFETPVDYRKL